MFFITACKFFAFQRLLDLRLGLTMGLVAVDFALSRITEVLTYGFSQGIQF